MSTVIPIVDNIQHRIVDNIQHPEGAAPTLASKIRDPHYYPPAVINAITIQSPGGAPPRPGQLTKIPLP